MTSSNSPMFMGLTGHPMLDNWVRTSKMFKAPYTFEELLQLILLNISIFFILTLRFPMHASLFQNKWKCHL